MKAFSYLLLGTALTVSACKVQPDSSVNTENAIIAQNEAMVVAANPHAVDAGIEVLRAGGSAVDAAIAVQVVLGLVEPQSSGLGGGAFMLVYDNKSGDVWAYNGRETAPENITQKLFYGEDGEPYRYFEGIKSGRSTGVPGAVAMLDQAHNDYGKLDWGDVHFKAGIELATKGFAISPRLADLLARMSRYGLSQHGATRDYFYQDDGKTPWPEGHILKNSNYANTLKALSAEPLALLKPPISTNIISTVQEEPRPGTLSQGDMDSYKTLKTPALCSPYRHYKICGPQPPASGGVAVQSILGQLQHFDMKALGPTIDGWHVFIEASFQAYADRNKYVADPDFVPVNTEALLNPEYLKSRAGAISLETAQKEITAGTPYPYPLGKDATPDNPGTSHFTVMDKDGLVVSMTTTVEGPFGSGRMVDGFFLNNQLTDFSFRTHDEDGLAIANAPAPKKRPRSSMGPTIVFDENGDFLFSTGSPGGNSIIAYIAKSIVGVLDWGLSPQDAVELPNVIARRGRVRLEAKGLIDEETNEPVRAGPAAEFGMSPDIVAGLEALGHTVVKSKGEISGLHIIYRNEDGSLSGAADPRREGVVGQ